MNAMTLLRAMSAIDPKDIEAAYQAAAGKPESLFRSPAMTSVSCDTAESPVLYPKPVSAGKRFAIGGWAAVAACIALVAAAGLYLRGSEDDLTTYSGSEPVEEITGTSPAEPVLTQGTESTVTVFVQTGTLTVSAAVPAVTETQTVPLPEGTVTAPPEPENSTAQTAAAEETAAASTTTEPTGTVVPADVPALLAVSDGSGVLTHPDGSAFAAEEFTYEAMQDAAAIRAFLERKDTPVTLGTGRTDDSGEIPAEPVLLHVCWQMPDDRWTSYGIQNAELTADGILHLTVGMYSSGAAAHPEPWIYETGLLCRADSVPAVTGAELTLQYYTDTEETGIQNYFLYLDALCDDITVHVNVS